MSPSNPQLDFSITHPVPGLGKPLDYVPTKDDPLYVGPPIATALLPVCKEMRENSLTSDSLLDLDSEEKNL